MHLLKNVRENYEESSGYGNYIQPGTVLRSDGTDKSRPDLPDLSAIFVSLPYFEIGNQRSPLALDDGTIHLGRGLYQSAYTQESGIDRDAEQIFRKFKAVKPDEYLRVPQLWVMLLNSGKIGLYFIQVDGPKSS